MTDMRNINSTSQTSRNSDGNMVRTVRDSLIAEILLSIIIGITILSISTLLKCYIELFEVSTYPTYSLLIVSVLHTIARRFRIKSKAAVFVLHVMVSLAFFLVAIQIPILEFGNSTPNTVYLIILLVAFTLFSFLYSLKPAFMAADIEFMAFPAVFHVIGYILYNIADRKDFANTILFNAIVIAIIFIIMRQIAVFDTKYYHSIHKISRPSSMLKKQNYKTVLGLILIIAVSLALLTIFPYAVLSDLLKSGLVLIFRFFIHLLLSNPSKEPESQLNDPFQRLNMAQEISEDNPILNIIAYITYFIIAALILTTVISGLLALFRNAPQTNKREEKVADENLIDTIEDIKPEKKKMFSKAHDFGSGRERRVRKQFYDKTRRAMKKGLPVSDSSSPGQIEKVLRENGDKDISSLKKEYEDIRYTK